VSVILDNWEVDGVTSVFVIMNTGLGE